MKNINFKSVIIRLLIFIIPIVLIPLGIACYYSCGLGADPYSVFIDGEHLFMGLTYGKVTTINNSILLIMMFIFGRKYLNIGSIITAFTTGPLLDWYNSFIMTQFPIETTDTIIKIIILLSGCIIFGVGIGIFVSVGLGVSPVDFIALFIADVSGWKLKYVRIATDFVFFLVGLLMGGTIGIGTVVGVLLTGPILEFTINKVKRPIEKLAGPIELVRPNIMTTKSF